MALNKSKLVMVEWLDAWAFHSEKKIKGLDCQPLLTYSVGWVIEENNNGILITPEYWPEDDQYASGVTFIPKGMIASVTTLVPESEK